MTDSVALGVIDVLRANCPVLLPASVVIEGASVKIWPAQPPSEAQKAVLSLWLAQRGGVTSLTFHFDKPSVAPP